MLGLGKKTEKNKKAQGKGINYRSHFVLVIKTLSECDHILGSIAVLLRGVKLVLECSYQSATRCFNSLHMHLGSSGMLTPLKMFVKIC